MSKLRYIIPLAAFFVLTSISACFAEAAGNGASGPASLTTGGIGIAVFTVCAVAAIALFIFRFSGRMKTKKAEIKTVEPEIKPMEQPAKSDPSGEIHAAIAMALYLYSSELHDQENPVITMIRTSKTYSPWSSKIYGLRRSPR